MVMRSKKRACITGACNGDFMNIFKKNKINKDVVEDVFAIEESDRRKLNYVPDDTHQRSDVDRRGGKFHDTDDYADYIYHQKVGQRYVIKNTVKLKVNHQTLTCESVNVSGSGMLIECADPETLEKIKNGNTVQVKFYIAPGQLPEGSEMKVKMKATVARTFEKDGKFYCGLKFKLDMFEYARQKKDRRIFVWSSLMLAFISLFIVLMRAKSLIFFRFHEFMYLYSIIAAVFLLSRYILAAFYRPVKVDMNFTPSVTVIIPCFNEEEWIQRTIIGCINQNYPADKLEVIVVDDHSTDRSVEKIKEMIETLEKDDGPVSAKGRISYLVQPKNMGKREALVEGVLRAKHELVVFVDSDSFLEPFAIRNLVQPFRDPQMGGVAGRTDVANTYTNALTKMQAVRYYIAFRVMKASEGLFDCVTCLSGPISCYRKDIVLAKKDEWLNQRFLGQKATFGDDRAMTNFVLREYRTTYQDTAICQTIVPNKYSTFIKQQMRWKRSWLRESLTAGTFIWKKEPFAAIFFYIGLIVPIFAPLIILYNAFYVPLTQNIFPTTFLIGIGLMAFLMSFSQLFYRKSSTWLYAIWFCLFYEMVLVWQMPIAIVTFWKSNWGTRMTWSDVKEAENVRFPRLRKALSSFFG